MDLCGAPTIAGTNVSHGPGEVGNIEYVAIETNAVTATTVSYLTDEDPTSGSFTAISNPVDPPNRTQGTNLVEKWFYVRNVTARRAAVKIAWAAASTEFRLYSIDMVGNEMQAA
jgi:hypothetical protein